jgi:hypothetical protein
MQKIEFETDMGCGYIEYIRRDDTGKNDTFDVVVEETYLGYDEDAVVADIENNINKYI